MQGGQNAKSPPRKNCASDGEPDTLAERNGDLIWRAAQLLLKAALRVRAEADER